MNRPTLIFTVILVSGLSLAAGIWLNHKLSSDGPTKSQLTTSSQIPTHRPDFRLKDIDGKLRDAKEWDDQVLMVNFWATWCPPCRREIPAFIELQEAYASKGLTIIGIAIDNLQATIDFTDPMGVNYPILIAEDEGISLSRSYGNRLGVLPYTVIIDRKGRIIHALRSELSFQQAEQLIKPLL